ncbi:MAG: hypothetical protein V3U39_09585, partial [Acidimicrobiia bacterium]
MDTKDCDQHQQYDHAAGDESQEKRCRHEVGGPGLRVLRLVTAEPQPHRRQEAIGKGIVDPR